MILSNDQSSVVFYVFGIRIIYACSSPSHSKDFVLLFGGPMVPPIATPMLFHYLKLHTFHSLDLMAMNNLNSCVRSLEMLS